MISSILTILAGGAVIFAGISIYLSYSKFLLRRAYNNLENGDLKVSKLLARLLLLTAFKACGYELLAEIAQLNKKYEEAVSLFSKALKFDCTLENSWAGLFECKICMGKIDEALHVISEATDRAPDNELIKVYKILVTRTAGSSTLSREELTLLAKHNICLDRDACKLEEVLLRICQP